MVSTSSGMNTLVSPLLLNALVPMDSTLVGMSMASRLVQFMNMDCGIAVMLDGSVTYCNDPQFWKIPFFHVVTLDGRLTHLRPDARKAPFPMVVSEDDGHSIDLMPYSRKQ